jgi:parallel beta-helix repeat protein
MCCYDRSSPTLTDCTISSNTASYEAGGVFCDYYSSPTLVKCTISGNRAPEYGGGVYCNHSSGPTLINCIIRQNSTSSGRGGGVFCDYSSSPALTSCAISGNSAGVHGGGVYCSYSSPTLTNCTISGNRAGYYGGGVCAGAASPKLINCTISGNTAASGGGVRCDSSSPTLTNCILWADTPQEIFVSSAIPVVTYCDVQGGYAGTGNLNLDPLFVNAAAGDYHLGPLSPCIDAGDPASDFSLEPEPDGGRINMGAYGNTPEAETKGWIYIQGYNIVSKTRIGRTLFQYDLTITAHNASSQGVTNLVATLLAVPSNVQIASGTVNVGSVPAGATVVSPGTFTIQVDRSVVLSPLPIGWRVTYSAGLSGEFTTLLELNPRLPGDMNCDGIVNFDDINPFVLALADAAAYYAQYPDCAYENADINGDTYVNFDDINPFVACLVNGGCP